MSNDRLLSLLGIVRKAGKLQSGSTRCEDAVKKRKACLVLIAADISDRTKGQMEFICSNNSVPCIVTGFSIEELSHAIGTNAGVCAVCDRALAEKVQSLTGKEDALL